MTDAIECNVGVKFGDCLTKKLFKKIDFPTEPRLIINLRT